VIEYSSFYQTKIRKTIFRNSQLHEADFAECDLTSALFDNCDLNGAAFDRTVLEKVDFRSSYHYTIDPEENRINKAKFSTAGIAGLLGKYDIEIADI
jgi:fluoroquinolone resistance protein